MTTTTKRVKITSLAVTAAVIAIAVLSYQTLVSTVEAQTATSTTSSSSAGLPATMKSSGWTMGLQPDRDGHHRERFPGISGGSNFAENQVNIAVGQTFTVTSAEGKYFVVGTPSNNGTASGTLTFTVTGKLSSGYIVSLSSGSLTAAGTTYTVTSGTALLNRGASSIRGEGATTNPAGLFILRALARGTFVGSTAMVSLDLQSGSSEYLVLLSGSVHS